MGILLGLLGSYLLQMTEYGSFSLSRITYGSFSLSRITDDVDVDIFVNVLFYIWGAMVGVNLRRVSKNAVAPAKIFFYALIASAVFVSLVHQNPAGLAPIVIWASWLGYLRQSKRVRSTFSYADDHGESD